MSCTFATLAACFHLSGFYVDTALIHSSIGESRIDNVSYGQIHWEHDEWRVDTRPHIDNSAQNPYVRVALGYDVQWNPRWATRIDYSHESSIATGQDRGVERISLGLTWRPFAK